MSFAFKDPSLSTTLTKLNISIHVLNSKPQNYKEVTLTICPLWEVVCHAQPMLGVVIVNQCAEFVVSIASLVPKTGKKRRRRTNKTGWFGVVRGH